MTAPAASSQLGWLLKHLDALTDSELHTLYLEVNRRMWPKLNFEVSTRGYVTTSSPSADAGTPRRR